MQSRPIERIGLGLAALGRPGYITLGHGSDLGADRSPEALETNAHVLLDAAWAAGVRVFDAARSYGRAEAFLASWLRRRGIGPREARVGSKWGYTYTADWRVDADVHEVKDHRLAVFERQWRESDALLGPHLSLYQVHSLTLDSPLWGDAALLRALATLRERGVVVGVSTSGPQQADAIERALGLEVDGAPLIGALQTTWNLLEPAAGPALAAAHARGVRVIVKEALANGRLAGRDDSDATAPLLAEAERLGCDPDALALAAACAQPWADTVLSGAATLAQLRSNLRAASLELDAATLARLEALAMPSERYWRERSRLAWN